MTGGAGYVLSRRALEIFVAGQGDNTTCRAGDQGPEDVEIARCLQRLGVNFIDTRDKFGRQNRLLGILMLMLQIRNRFFHISGEDAVSLKENVNQPHLNWILNYGMLPLQVSLEFGCMQYVRQEG